MEKLMVKIRSYRISHRPQIQVTVPKSYVMELGLAEGDRIDVYLDTEDRLILVPKKAEKEQG